MKQLLLILTLIFSFNAIAVEEFPVEHFFKDPAMTGPQLSPDGQYMAALTPLNINRETVARCKKKNRRKKSGIVDFCDVSRRNFIVFSLNDSNYIFHNLQLFFHLFL